VGPLPLIRERGSHTKLKAFPGVSGDAGDGMSGVMAAVLILTLMRVSLD
jgi:hypothetical protein